MKKKVTALILTLFLLLPLGVSAEIDTNLIPARDPVVEYANYNIKVTYLDSWYLSDFIVTHTKDYDKNAVYSVTYTYHPYEIFHRNEMFFKIFVLKSAIWDSLTETEKANYGSQFHTDKENSLVYTIIKAKVNPYSKVTFWLDYLKFKNMLETLTRDNSFVEIDPSLGFAEFEIKKGHFVNNPETVFSSLKDITVTPGGYIITMERSEIDGRNYLKESYNPANIKYEQLDKQVYFSGADADKLISALKKLDLTKYELLKGNDYELRRYKLDDGYSIDIVFLRPNDTIKEFPSYLKTYRESDNSGFSMGAEINIHIKNSQNLTLALLKLNCNSQFVKSKTTPAVKKEEYLSNASFLSYIDQITADFDSEDVRTTQSQLADKVTCELTAPFTIKGETYSSTFTFDLKISGDENYKFDAEYKLKYETIDNKTGLSND